jgi:hypothetical protein
LEPGNNIGSVMIQGHWFLLFLLILANQPAAQAQIDPEKRRLIQLGYNQPLEGRGPIAGYGFFYYNKPQFCSTNLTLRLAIAPIYLDSELGFSGLLGPKTDLAVGLAGGGFADSYSEIRQGAYLRNESFLGDGGEFSSSIYHRFNPDQTLPVWAILRASVHQSFYEPDDQTGARFEIPDARTEVHLRTGLRLGGKEPSLTEPLALEFSLWHETQLRAKSEFYGFAGDRKVESRSHLFWTRGLMKYVFGQTEQMIESSLTAGTSLKPDRFSAYRLGGNLPFVSEFPLNIPGYYFQELSASRFALLNAQYSFPIEASKAWRMDVFGAAGPVEYLAGLEQPRRWHAGAGGGITYISPYGSWFVTLVYGHGFGALRSHGEGANQVALLFQYDFEAKKRGKLRWFIPGSNPYSSQGGERIFR